MATWLSIAEAIPMAIWPAYIKNDGVFFKGVKLFKTSDLQC